MAYFHVTAIFETRGVSQEEAERTTVAVLSSLRHPRVHYYEHETNGGTGPYPPGKSLYFTTMAEFDVEAHSEEKAVDVVEDVLDRISTETVQYLGHGIISGAQRVQPEQKKPRETARSVEREPEEEPEEQEAGTRGRRPRGRRRKRPSGRETEDSATAQVRDSDTPVEEPVEALIEVAPPEREPVAPVSPAVHVVAEAPTTAVESPLSLVEEPLPLPPARSSGLMRVTLTIDLRASELTLTLADGQAVDDLTPLAITEARRRHPELPADVVPDATTAVLPGGDQVVSLTWSYTAPVPSAAESE